MKRFLKRMHRGSKGFTLIELLIVIAILGVLAAIALPNFSGIINRGEAQAALAEKVTVQTAVDAMMAVNFLGDGDVVPPVAATDNMSEFPNTTPPLYSGFMRTEMTTGTYNCDANGLVEQTLTGYE